LHGLRHSLISNLARAGVHPRNAQALARHSTIDLTMNVHTHVSMHDLRRDVESLPALGAASSDPAAAPGAVTVPQATEAAGGVPTTAVPEELSGLTHKWGELPEHIRSAIVSLAHG